MNTPPTVRQEINRKTWEALERLLSRRVSDEIDDRQLDVAIDTLWDAVSGLADRDLMEMFSKFK